MKKLIIDTDIGDDIDDAFAIALAAAAPEVELIGVTTVFRNTVARAHLVKQLLNAANCTHTQIYAGEGRPLKEPFHLFEKDSPAVPPEEQLPCQWEQSYSAPVEGGAADWLIRAAEEYGKELTVVAIGPLTNLAKAIEKAPESMKKLGAIVCMGGSFSQYMAEWNVLCDPEAAQTVYASGIPFYAVGLDVTMQCPLEHDLLDKFERSEKAVNRLLTMWLKRWFAYFNFEKSVMHDPLAVACCFTDVCKFTRKYVKADLEKTRGAVLVSDTPKEGFSPVFIAESVEKDKFYTTVKENLL